MRGLVLSFLLFFFASPAAAQTLPPDAAPPDEQQMRLFEIDGPYMEWFKTIYKRSPATDLISEPLVRMDRNYDLLPAGATSWEATPDGSAWIFHLRPGMRWDDGRPFTAHDYVFTFRRGADPRTAYDFEWYYRAIKNWGHVVERRMPVDSLGVEAIDDLTLVIRTERPVPYLPYNVNQSWASPKQAVEKYGDEWSTRPETSVSAGPFRLSQWLKNEKIVLDANPKYRGSAPPYLRRVIYYLFSQAGQPPMMAAYESGEVDMILVSGQASLGRIKSDPTLRDELRSMVNFVTFYLTMDTYKGVFQDLRVRRAFGYAIDRQALMNSALRDIAIPAYAMLPPGFPGADSEPFKALQPYDPEQARKYLAEAGYPDGKGFPPIDIWLRGRDAGDTRTAAEAIQAMLKKALNITVGIRTVETKLFTDGLNNHSVTLALVPYSLDYPDPSNLLGIWRSSGRHAWRHEGFERLMSEGDTFMGSTTERYAIYHRAERYLVEDAGGVFLWHPVQYWLWKPYIKSPDLQPNRVGMTSWSNLALMSGYVARREPNAGRAGFFESLWEYVTRFFE
ncbi:MAG: peptide ABC transporter substrate-binding protein [candidate division Zixibacteria bacterium]|nr:peptide ABC transporter substrate-binding protein [candidate division Zixibacteria bacterium]